MMLRVLVVDDEPAIAGTLQAYLEDEGMQVVSTDSAESALELVQHGESYDVCIMDMRLPGMDGDAAICQLHALRPRLRFIIHTGTAGYSVSDNLRALGIGDNQLFLKPMLDMAPLARTVRSLGIGA